jgi:hypothetical protein
MDFSQSYLKSGLSIAVPAEESEYRWLRIFEVGDHRIPGERSLRGLMERLDDAIEIGGDDRNCCSEGEKRQGPGNASLGLHLNVEPLADERAEVLAIRAYVEMLGGVFVFTVLDKAFDFGLLIVGDRCHLEELAPHRRAVVVRPAGADEGVTPLGGRKLLTIASMTGAFSISIRA